MPQVFFCGSRLSLSPRLEIFEIWLIWSPLKVEKLFSFPCLPASNSVWKALIYKRWLKASRASVQLISTALRGLRRNSLDRGLGKCAPWSPWWNMPRHCNPQSFTMWLCYGFNWLHNSLYRLCRQVIQVSALFAVEVPDSAPDTEIASENCHPHRTCFPSNPW